MRIRESSLKLLIRKILKEQVLGYTPPEESKKDAGYMSYGDISAPAASKPDPDEDPEDYEQLETQKQTLTKQRQKATNTGNAPQANYDAGVLRKLSQATG